MAPFVYEFEWDPVKARTNFNKHRLDFSRAATVFTDPLAVTVPDEEHGETNWRNPGQVDTMGKDYAGSYVRVVHTFAQLDKDRGRIRLISARKPTKAEIQNYEER